ncbi:MAG: hypothetical protein WKF97_23485 [Chitinophagaceae bacterium]
MANKIYRFNILFIPATILFSFVFFTSSGQYYYKDLVTTQRINETFRLYKSNKVRQVKLNSFQGNVEVSEGFICEQQINLARNQVITYAKTADAGESFLTTYYNAQGLLIKTLDSTEETVSISTYQYDAANRLYHLSHQTSATDNSSKMLETHTWRYTASGKPEQMLRVKNGTDSTTVRFTLDEKENVAEEQAFNKGVSQAKFFYYYDEENRLTDVVRYNNKARRLLPDYIFEYEENGELSTLTIVPEGSSDYQKWYYKYDEAGLKQIEFCYNKNSQLLGKIEYNYVAN